MGRRCHAAAALAVLGLILTTFTASQAQTLTARQSEALATYDRALGDFKSILAERRRQIAAKEPLPNLPGQALYLARVAVISAYKDLTDAMPSRIGKPNKFEIPPAYFDADIEPLVDEYAGLFEIMEAPPAGAQNSPTPFKDVVDLAVAIARAKGLAPGHAEAAGRISLGLFFAETNGKQNVRNARSNTYMGSFQTARPRTATAAGNGSLSRARSRRPIPRWPRVTTGKRHAPAAPITVSITGPMCATA